MAGISVIAIGDHFGKDQGEVVGYYGDRKRRVGERFVIKDEKDFSTRWMTKLTSKESKEVVEEEADKAADTKRNRKPASVL